MIEALSILRKHWSIALLIVAGVLLLGQRLYIASLDAQLAKSKQEMSDLKSEADRVALELTQQIVKNQQAHARAQSEKEAAYEEDLKRQAAARAADRRELDRLRVAIKAYAHGGRTETGVDAPAGISQEDRLDRLAGLLAEGVELVVESRGVVERRDAEVKRLLDQIALDRTACMAD